MAYSGFATPGGTASFRDSFAVQSDSDHFREWDDLWLSSIGIGTYLGESDEETDAAYRDSVARAVRGGCNVIDSAINYRFQRSERCVGEALASLLGAGDARREEVFLTTKGGFIPFDGAPPKDAKEFTDYLKRTYFDSGCCGREDIVANCHCMTPAYLRHELEASLGNLGVDTVNVYYVHNPETQLQEVSREVFRDRLTAAFSELEAAAGEGKIRSYGTATWAGFRADPAEEEYLSLEEVIGCAEAAGGEGHRFRAVQLPLNLGLPEAFSKPNQTVRGKRMSFLAAAAHLGVGVMASGSIHQGRMAAGLPLDVAEAFPGLSTDAQRAIQFTRSAPGVTVALVGMRQAAHVEDNLAVAEAAPASFDQFMKLFRPA
jgi:aryl-alcohol dehydrogenase-like predicted oxidoreductase